MRDHATAIVLDVSRVVRIDRGLNNWRPARGTGFHHWRASHVAVAVSLTEPARPQLFNENPPPCVVPDPLLGKVNDSPGAVAVPGPSAATVVVPAPFRAIVTLGGAFRT